MEYREYLKNLIEKVQIPAECGESLLAFEEKIAAKPELESFVNAAVHYYMYPVVGNMSEIVQKLESAAKAWGVSHRRLLAVFVLRCTPIMKERYEAAGIDEEIFWQGIDDIRCKLLESKECYGEYGLINSWFGDMLSLTRFALGRFQYLLERYEGDGVCFPNGYMLKKGDTYVAFHIPSSGVPLTDEVRLDSYRRAEQFFKKDFPNGPVILSTDSWIIYPGQRLFLPEKSNLRRFMDDFYIATMREQEFKDAWRLFGASAALPVEQWYEKTSMQRAYKKWVMDGNMTGRARGFILMENGENVTHTKKW